MTDTFDSTRVAWAMDAVALARLQAVLEVSYEVSFDLETTGLNEWEDRAKIVLVSFTVCAPDQTEPDTWLVPLYHPESPWLGAWRGVMRALAESLKGKFLIAQNGKFDCRWIHRHTGVDLSHDLMWDTRISSHLLDENASTKLKERAPVTFGIDRWDDFDLTTPGAALEVPLFDLGYYGARDTYWTWRLAEAHRDRMFVLEETYPPTEDDEIEEARLGRLAYWVAMPTARTMTALEQRGIKLDEPWVEERIAEDEESRRSEQEFLIHGRGYEGLDLKWASFAPTSHWFLNWSTKAVEAGDLKVAALTKGGKPQWSKQVLTRQAREGSAVAHSLLVLRGAAKRLEYLHMWLNCLRSDGNIHATYNVGALITGRLSSSDPNMQQITKKLRPAFVPRPGFVIVDFDYSQIELRVAAFIARCLPMIEAFKRGDDLHRLIAARITGKAPEFVTAPERQGGKAGNFGFLFGQSAYGFRFYAENTYGLSFNDREAQVIYDAFFSEWDGMAQWHAKTISRAHSTGQVVSPLGRVRRLPGLYSSNEGHIKHSENAALNAPVQGFASDLMQIASALIEGTLPGSTAVEGARLVTTVHDSIGVEILADRWEEVSHEIIDRMVNGVLPVLKRLDCEFDVPLAVEAVAGTRWGLNDVGEIK